MSNHNENPFSTSLRDMGDAQPHLRARDLVDGVTLPESVARKGCSLGGDDSVDGDEVGHLTNGDLRATRANSRATGGRNA